MADCSTCLNHSAHERAIKFHDQRLDKYNEELDSLRDCVIRLTALQEQSLEWKKEAEERITALENVPASRWEKVVSTLITGIVSAVVGAASALIAMNGGV